MKLYLRFGKCRICALIQRRDCIVVEIDRRSGAVRSIHDKEQDLGYALIS